MIVNRRDAIRTAWACGAFALCPDSVDAAGTARPPVIAAASSLRFCMDQLLGAFYAAGGAPLRVVFGSSGNLVRQIEQGAPFAMFLSADEDYARRLAKAKFSADNGAIYAVGRVALVARKGKTVGIDRQLAGVAAALHAGQIRRFAIANPDHAPYGARAKDILRHARLWSALQGKLVLGENVAQAAQFVGSGAADAGLIASSLAQAPRYRKMVNQALIPASWHSPLPQRMLQLASATAPAGRAARHFYEFLTSAAARAILKRSGFDLPGAA